MLHCGATAATAPQHAKVQNFMAQQGCPPTHAQRSGILAFACPVGMGLSFTVETFAKSTHWIQPGEASEIAKLTFHLFHLWVYGRYMEI